MNAEGRPESREAKTKRLAKARAVARRRVAAAREEAERAHRAEAAQKRAAVEARLDAEFAARLTAPVVDPALIVQVFALAADELADALADGVKVDPIDTLHSVARQIAGSGSLYPNRPEGAVGAHGGRRAALFAQVRAAFEDAAGGRLETFLNDKATTAATVIAAFRAMAVNGPPLPPPSRQEHPNATCALPGSQQVPTAPTAARRWLSADLVGKAPPITASTSANDLRLQDRPEAEPL